MVEQKFTIEFQEVMMGRTMASKVNRYLNYASVVALNAAT